MDHTTTTPGAADGRDEPRTPGPVANPRRTRVGADGRPVSGAGTTAPD